jgi:hypothetical protein
MSGTAQLRGIHVRRAKLLGLDAPTKLDVRGLYRTGIDEISAERQARRAVLEALPIRRASTDGSLRLARVCPNGNRWTLLLT